MRPNHPAMYEQDYLARFIVHFLVTDYG